MKVSIVGKLGVCTFPDLASAWQKRMLWFGFSCKISQEEMEWECPR